MDTLVVVGVETVAGANLAVELQSRFRVVGLTSIPAIQLEGCSVHHIQNHDAVTVRQWLQQERPRWVVFCGQAAQSCWDESLACGFEDAAAIAWANGAHDAGVVFTMLSSDAVFAGPWLSHVEDDDEHFCSTARAQHIRQVEESVIAAHPGALVVRTHVFGWSPRTSSVGVVEKLLAQLELEEELSIDCLRHASPLLATDLANMLAQAFDEEVSGLLHLAGGERINPYFFAELLAEAAGLARPNYEWIEELTDPAVGFGCSETTLDCSQARELLEQPMPILVDGINRLIEQRSNGHCEKLHAKGRSLSRVA